ncbi:DUF4170 domain-containing protein [Roseomonas sp. NAR14]|uniref:DUF4170 domain-containing protein n=1 Tax=Roseomonas acroporae TaxID=2937791 RepID=A0A9X1Y460_9PROT|nr:DUF4170 domain-containing protein [Roseomonas acroporae]MCK8783874.1 DUF4170 domain-containing protein [Roseomonas acroporae]
MADPKSPIAPTLYFVWGGVFVDREFHTLEAGTEECYGPFHDADTAERTWKEKARRNIDIAQHRLFVISAPQPGW